jgi:hypothetical protein
MIVKDREGNRLFEVREASLLDQCDLRRADFAGQNLDGACLTESDLREADLTGASLYWARAFRANFDNAILRNAELNGANLEEATLRGTDLRGAYLSLDNMFGSPSLAGADLTGAQTEGAIFIGCTYNEFTRFPDGFDPGKHGMITVAEQVGRRALEAPPVLSCQPDPE